MLEGKRFLPQTGMPILNRARKSELLAVWLPEPLTVATTIEKSLIPGGFSRMSATRGWLWTLVALMRCSTLSVLPGGIADRGYRVIARGRARSVSFLGPRQRMHSIIT